MIWLGRIWLWPQDIAGLGDIVQLTGGIAVEGTESRIPLQKRLSLTVDVHTENPITHEGQESNLVFMGENI